MLHTTKEAILAILRADPQVTKSQARAVLAAASADPSTQSEPIRRIISRNEAALLLGRSVKRVDQLARAGILIRISAPGTTRAIGYTEASIRALTEGAA